MKGILNAISHTDTGTPVIWLANKDNPVTPPSIKPLGSKNPFKPKAARKTPTNTNNHFPVFCLNEIKYFFRLLYIVAKIVLFEIDEPEDFQKVHKSFAEHKRLVIFASVDEKNNFIYFLVVANVISLAIPLVIYLY